MSRNVRDLHSYYSLDIGNKNSNKSAHTLTPKFISGFALNPLDLLASTTADRSNKNKNHNIHSKNNRSSYSNHSLSISQSSKLQQTTSLCIDPCLQSYIVSIPTT